MARRGLLRRARDATVKHLRTPGGDHEMVAPIAP
jgi:hypothetical protein